MRGRFSWQHCRPNIGGQEVAIARRVEDPEVVTPGQDKLTGPEIRRWRLDGLDETTDAFAGQLPGRRLDPAPARRVMM